MLGKQVVQRLEDKRLTHKFDKLQVAAKECEKGDRTHKRYERAAANAAINDIPDYPPHGEGTGRGGDFPPISTKIPPRGWGISACVHDVF